MVIRDGKAVRMVFENGWVVSMVPDLTRRTGTDVMFWQGRNPDHTVRFSDGFEGTTSELLGLSDLQILKVLTHVSVMPSLPNLPPWVGEQLAALVK